VRWSGCGAPRAVEGAAFVRTVYGEDEPHEVKRGTSTDPARVRISSRRLCPDASEQTSQSRPFGHQSGVRPPRSGGSPPAVVNEGTAVSDDWDGVRTALGFDSYGGDPHVWRGRVLAAVRGASVLPWGGERSVEEQIRTTSAAERHSVVRNRATPMAPARELNAGLVQQSRMIRGGAGARLRDLAIRPIDLHVHLLGARVEVVMKAHRRRNGEGLRRERNDYARRTEPLTWYRTARWSHR
jgi:hypothetical protein